MIEASWSTFCTLLPARSFAQLLRRREERQKCGFAQARPYKQVSEVNDKRIQKWVLRGGNWEWNRFFRKSNCLLIALRRADRSCQILAVITLCSMRLGARNSAKILNAKFVKSWISRGISKVLSCQRDIFCFCRQFHCLSFAYLMMINSFLGLSTLFLDFISRKALVFVHQQ